MSAVINHLPVQYLASHVQLWSSRESLALSSSSAELQPRDFPSTNLKGALWQEPNSFCSATAALGIPQAPSRRWNSFGVTHGMADAALTNPHVVKLWHRGKNPNCWNSPSLQGEAGPVTCSVCLPHESVLAEEWARVGKTIPREGVTPGTAPASKIRSVIDM